jgi:hypothetical protein
MCFSASASFGAGVALSIVGFVAIKKAKTSSQIMFANIPLFFAVQQLSEGFLWLSLTNPDFIFLKEVMTYNFLFFAHIIWPFWVPLAVLWLEKNEKRKLLLNGLLALGVLVSLFLAYYLTNYRVEGRIENHHIDYVLDYPNELSRHGGILYGAATILPAFFSTVKRMWILGVTILISYMFTAVLYEDYILSVWCYFASIISIVILLILDSIPKPAKVTLSST